MDDGSGTANGTRFGITEAAHHGDECTTLLGVLQRQRDLVAWKLRDVPDDVLGAVATPTGMGLHGLVRHLTNVERSWLRDVFAGEEGLVFDWTERDPDAEWRVPADMKMADLLGDYAAESRRCSSDGRRLTRCRLGPAGHVAALDPAAPGRGDCTPPWAYRPAARAGRRQHR
jgi:hypothetical protein